jgi:hypothetical protein
MDQLLGTTGLIIGKNGQGKSHIIKKEILPIFGDNAIIYDFHGDYEKEGLPGKKFSMMQAKEFIDFCAREDIKNKLIIAEEADNFLPRDNKNPFNVDRIKVKWIMSRVGNHHNNNCFITIWHALPQIPDEMKYFYDWCFLFDQEASYKKVKEYWDGDKFFDAYQLHEQMYNSDKEKIRKPDGTLVKPPLIFSRTKDLPKMNAA